MTYEIIAKNHLKIVVEKRDIGNQYEISICMHSKLHCRLHWGISSEIGGEWRIPILSNWQAESAVFGESALQTSFKSNGGENRITIKLDKNKDLSCLHFALFYPDTNTWDNNCGKNYQIELVDRSRKAFSLQKICENLIKDGKIIHKCDYDIDKGSKLSVAVIKDENTYKVIFISNIHENIILHWGVAVESPYVWTLPDNSMWPDGTIAFDDKAVQTAFIKQNNLNRLIIEINQKEVPAGIPFVITFSDSDRWLKERGRNFYVPVSELLDREQCSGSGDYSQIAGEIIGSEMERNSWTLMHRFNLCYDLLDRTGNEENGLALIFIWMRYSFLRQLDWQRNYNTQPRELSHAQDRLTLKLAAFYCSNPDGRELIRLIISTLGRGGEGQRIRDEILHIMHRHRIKEVAGHFLEEWHQKLHNNTTPDDIVICKAYIEFLKNDGNLELFYQTLESGGVTRKRLESFERPIVTPPDFIPHLKEPLIYDFENYLKLFKSVHSGTDLESAADAARYLFDDEMNCLWSFISQHRDDNTISDERLAEHITILRSRLNTMLNIENESGKVRDILYLDIALEEFMRLVVERNLARDIDRDQLVELISLVLKNTLFSCPNFEFAESYRHWELLKIMSRFGQDWSLHAKSVLDRLERGIIAMSDKYNVLLQDKAIFLGKAFQAEKWTINMFSEEIVRGRLSFILSLLVHHLDPILRKSAELGDWQIISPGQAIGVVEVVESLKSIQNKTFSVPSIVIAEKVSGDEEPPEGLNAVVTPDMVDLVSHVAIRARNANLLFATCYDQNTLRYLKSFNGCKVALSVNTSGDVVIKETTEVVAERSLGLKASLRKMILPEFTSFAITSNEFHENLVGGKSLNLHTLSGRLPDWIHTPSSVAIPFGVFERVLALNENRKIAGLLNNYVKDIVGNPGEILPKIRKIILDLVAPEELILSICSAMGESEITLPGDCPGNRRKAWECIKKVWASKWNDRAYLSRCTQGISHEDLFMAVLVQQVVKSEYAFVIHTVNPFSDNRDELYAEVVAGLGETLVGNYPGRAFSFTALKVTKEPRVFAYPSKSIGLFGGSLIFRSDSNGEDLEGYAGAGLYDSIHLELPEEVSLKYSKEPLIWNMGFRKELMTAITELGTIIEKIMGSPQDIEGTYANGRYYVVQTRPQV